MKLHLLLYTWILSAAFGVAPRADAAGAAGGARAGEDGGITPVELRRDRNRIYHSQGDDGSSWVRGTTYKAGFDAHGAQYIPFLGSAAPRNYPVALSVEEASVAGAPIAFDAAAAPTRAGDVIAFERGGFVEAYALGLDSIEQTFAFDALPARGEIVLRIGIGSELVASESSDALLLRNERGGVRYGRAIAVDALGRSTAAPTEWTATGIEIRVASWFVEAAELPLVIDPLIQTWTVDDVAFDDTLADVVFNTTSGWMAVYEEVFSATDHDVVATWIESDTTNYWSGYVDGNLSNYWANPAIANNFALHNFLIVAEVGLPSAHQRAIRSRTLNPIGSTLGPDVLVSAQDTGDMINADVGGDPDIFSSSHYLVVWERVLGTEHDIHGRYVYGYGGLDGSAPVMIDNSVGTEDSRPAISKSNLVSTWSIVWQRHLSNGNWAVRGAQFYNDGTFGVPSFEIQTGLTGEPLPDVSSPLPGTAQYLVVWQKENGADHNIHARLMYQTTSLDFQNLTQLESNAGSGALNRDQIHASVDANNTAFVLGYSEQVGTSTTDYDAYCASFGVVNDHLLVSEGHVRLSSTSNREDRVQVTAASHSGYNVPRCFVIWDGALTGSDHDIQGAFYDSSQFTRFCSPGVAGTIDCPCSNPHSSWTRGCDNSAGTGGARIDVAGNAFIGADTMVLTSTHQLPSSLSVFFQGSALTSPMSGVVYGQGVRCVAGALKRLYTKNAIGGAVTAPAGPEPSIHDRSAALGDPLSPGFVRYYFVFYRDPFVLGGCSSASTFNASTAIRTLWR